MSTFNGKRWVDGNLLVDDNTYVSHRTKDSKLMSILNTDNENIYLSDLFIFVSDLFNRNTGTVSIFWHVHGDLIYALTGIFYCEKIVIHVGKQLEDNTYEIFTKPKFFVHVNNNITEASPHVKFEISLRRPPTIPKALRTTDVFEYVFNAELLTVKELSTFSSNLASIYNAIKNQMISESSVEREILGYCQMRATEQKLMLMNGSELDNFLLKQACLFMLEANSDFDRIKGSIRAKAVSGNRFVLHKSMLNTAYSLAVVLNSIYQNRSKLPAIVDRNPDTITVIKKYYEPFIEVNNTVLFYGMMAINMLYDKWSFLPIVNHFKAYIKIDADASKDDIVRLLQM